MMSTKQLLIMIDRISRDGQSREKVLRGLGYVFKQIANEMTIYAPKSEYKKPFEKLAALVLFYRTIFDAKIETRFDSLFQIV